MVISLSGSKPDTQWDPSHPYSYRFSHVQYKISICPHCPNINHQLYKQVLLKYRFMSGCGTVTDSMAICSLNIELVPRLPSTFPNQTAMNFVLLFLLINCMMIQLPFCGSHNTWRITALSDISTNFHATIRTHSFLVPDVILIDSGIPFH